MKLISSIIFLTAILNFNSYSQSIQVDKFDPAGYVTKYNKQFNGIGPTVYVLPAPRTLAEEIIETYAETNSFQDSINKGLIYARLLNNFQKTSKYDDIKNIIISNNTESNLQDLIKKYTAENKKDIVAALYNELAYIYLKSKKTNIAISYLSKALENSVNNTDDKSIIQSNFAHLYLFTKNYTEAIKNQESVLKIATDSKNLIKQANALTDLALMQAYNKNYNTTENNIIRKAIPLYNKSNDYTGKINAWIILAENYRLQNRHTEAQWFLIQARDLAITHKQEKQLPIIEYMMGSSKMIQNNYKVAASELSKALDLSKIENNQYLQLAIIDQLGRANMHLKNYTEAKSYLNQYWDLRKSLFL